MMKKNTLLDQQKIKGVGLVEVLVSILVLGVGALGVTSMQLTGLKYSSGTQGRTQAALLANDMMDRMRANRALAMAANDYQIAALSRTGSTDVPAITATTDCYTATCTPQNLAVFDKFHFVSSVERFLPFGRASITFDDSGTERVVEITLQWMNVATRQNREGFTPTDDELDEFSFRSTL